MIELSCRTAEIIVRLFSAKDGEQARRLLETECAENLPLVHSPSPEKLEWIRFANLRLSKGDLGKLMEMLLVAQEDWRDLLVAGGFAHSTDAHDEWADKVIGSTWLFSPPSTRDHGAAFLAVCYAKLAFFMPSDPS